MLTILSPAKRLKLAPGAPESEPAFHDDAAALLSMLRNASAADLAALMGLSDKLAALNRDRYRGWDDAPILSAVHAFAGDTYAGLDVGSIDADAIRWAQWHLRILSGLYGLLRPLDAIRPYRLEMGTRLANGRGRDLYAFWGDRLAHALDAKAASVGARWLLNCASVEYFRAVDRAALRLPVVTPRFLEDQPGGPRIVSFAAKRARGAMARFVTETRIADPSDLRAFDAGGYEWQAERSTPEAPVFLRRHRAAEAA